jgi:hypothetical protein
MLNIVHLGTIKKILFQENNSKRWMTGLNCDESGTSCLWDSKTKCVDFVV